MAKSHAHSTSVSAAVTAQQAPVGPWVWTHVSARYVGPMVKALITDVRRIYPNTIVARDFDVIDIPFKKEV